MTDYSAKNMATTSQKKIKTSNLIKGIIILLIVIGSFMIIGRGKSLNYSPLQIITHYIFAWVVLSIIFFLVVCNHQEEEENDY
jgi:hypothetical protein